MNRQLRSSLKFNNNVTVKPFSQFRPVSMSMTIVKPTAKTGEKRTLKSALKASLKTPIKPIKQKTSYVLTEEQDQISKERKSKKEVPIEKLLPHLRFLFNEEEDDDDDTFPFQLEAPAGILKYRI